jgi:hypothetical protein
MFREAHNWKDKKVPEEVKLMLFESLTGDDNSKKGNWFSLLDLGWKFMCTCF